MSGLVTLGYEGRTAAEVVDLVRDAGAGVLVDVRRTPLSHKPGLSKRRLAEAMQAAGVEYVHLPEVGVPKEERDAFRAGERSALAALRARLRSGDGKAAVRRVADLANERTVALLCFEREPEQCHRRVVSDEVVRVAPGLTVTHL